MHAAQDSKINLLLPSEFELSFWGKFLKWLVTTGRYVIIVTELIIIIAFLSRFKLDSEVASLTDEIRGKKNLLDAQAAIETQFLAVQSRLSAAEQVMDNNLAVGNEISEVVKTIPAGVKLKSLNITKSSDSITANAAENVNLGIMLRQMSRHGHWKGVAVTSINADELEGIILSLNLKR